MLYWAIDITFYAGTAFFVVAGLMALRHIYGTGSDRLARVSGVLSIGATLLGLALVLRGLAWGTVPLTTTVDVVSLFAMLTAIVMLYVLRKQNAPALLCFYAPPLALACLVNAAVAHNTLHTAPRALQTLPLTLHVGLAFLAYALFFLASMTSAAYLFQANGLKYRRTNGLFQRLPSLEQLDWALWRLVVSGYVLFVATLLLGFVWAWLDHELLESRWWLAPKVVMSYVLVAFYALLFHLRTYGRLRGPKLSYLMLIGFAVLLLAYFAMGLTQLRDYNFWGANV